VTEVKENDILIATAKAFVGKGYWRPGRPYIVETDSVLGLRIRPQDGISFVLKCPSKQDIAEGLFIHIPKEQYDPVQEITDPVERRALEFYELFCKMTNRLQFRWDHGIPDAEKSAWLEIAKRSMASKDVVQSLMQHIEKMILVICEYLPPDGISRKEALSKLIYLLDGPERREVFAKANAVLGEIS
jgi:hypothetical protein